MYCNYCGKEIKEDAIFCKHCGKKIRNYTDEAEVKNATEASVKNSFCQCDDNDKQQKDDEGSPKACFRLKRASVLAWGITVTCLALIIFFVALPKNHSDPTIGYIHGHEYVDLGLSVKWAMCNIGALSPADYGCYYAWGETQEKMEYTEQTSVTFNEKIRRIGGNEKYDVATFMWGSPWRLPSKREVHELIDKAIWTPVVQDGHNGYKVTGPNGNSIFLPSGGWVSESMLWLEGECGFYWSSQPRNKDCSYNILINGYGPCFDWEPRYHGMLVRAVLK